MRIRAITVSAALLLALVPATWGRAGTAAPGWTHPDLVHSFGQFDADTWDLITFNQRAYAALSVTENSMRRLYFKTNDTATAAFRSERVAEFPASTVVDTVSIGVAPGGNVYIAYSIDPNVGDPSTFVATDASGSWVSVPVPSTGDRGAISGPRYPDLAIQSDGTVAVAFQTQKQAPCTGDGDIFVTTFAGGAFSTPTNVTHNNTDGTLCVFNTFPSLAASGTTLHLAYRWVSSTGAGVQLHYRSGTLLNATDEVVDATSTSVSGYGIEQFGIDLVADAGGVPHIGYATANDGNASSFSMRYAVKPATTWTMEEVQEVTGRVRGPSVAVAVDQAAVAYGVGSDAFVAKRGASTWLVADLHTGNSQSFDPDIAAAAGRFHALFVEINGHVGAQSAAYLYQHEAPKPSVEFNLTGGKTFEGGEPVRMHGDIDPATVPERVVVHTQRLKGSRWIRVDLKRTRTNARGEWSFRHEALPAGRTYRARAEVGDTIDHRAGKNPWVRFEVLGRRNH
jgi:hypothetical protein